jgi:hypothetical protein
LDRSVGVDVVVVDNTFAVASVLAVFLLHQQAIPPLVVLGTVDEQVCRDIGQAVVDRCLDSVG